MNQLSVIVPVYHSHDTLDELIERLDKTLTNFAENYEILLIDDGSRDHSWTVIEKITKERTKARGIQLTRNYGQHSAVLCGIRQAQYEIIVTIDDDLQNPPEEIPKLIKKLNEGYDVVYARPRVEHHGLFRVLASQLSKKVLQETMGAQTASQISSFRAFRCSLRLAFEDYQASFVNIDVLLTWGTDRFASVVVDHQTRATGSSRYTFSQLVRHTLNMVTGFSVIPLQLASLIGLLFTLFGLGVLVYVLSQYLIHGRVVQGFAFLASIIAIFSGAQLFALGIFGEYLGRIHSRSMKKPLYCIRQRTDQKI